MPADEHDGPVLALICLHGVLSVAVHGDGRRKQARATEHQLAQDLRSHGGNGRQFQTSLQAVRSSVIGSVLRAVEPVRTEMTAWAVASTGSIGAGSTHGAASRRSASIRRAA